MAATEEQVMEFVGQAVGDFGALLTGALVVIGDKTGLFKALADAGSVTPAELAERSECNERYVREWLSGLAAAGYVAYDDDGTGCGPSSRDWFNEEACFDAEGDDPVAGFRVCASPARTILDTGEGGGGFRGVALWLDGDDLVIISQLAAGWHRYVSQWRLHAGGTIRPRVGFAAVSNP